MQKQAAKQINGEKSEQRTKKDQLILTATDEKETINREGKNNNNNNYNNPKGLNTFDVR